MTEHASAHAPDPKDRPARRHTARPIAEAVDLGWRVAALYALRPRSLQPPSPVGDDLLLNRRSLAAADRLELEVRAIAGVAADVGVPLADGELERLLAFAAAAGGSAAGERDFRDALSSAHLTFEKQLWAAGEPSGKAYELGNFISDTWNRVVWPRAMPDADSELREVFGPVRVERIKVLLDDLQARLDPIAAHTVSSHLDAWRDGLLAAPPETAPRTAEEVVRRYEPIERQTIIWRQMLTGDKEPEAYIGHARRAEVRDELTKQLWKRYRRPLPWLLPLVVALGVAVGGLYSGHRDDAQRVLGIVLTLAGALGVTRATMIGTVRRGLQSWGDLMWNRALTAVICRETLLLHELYAPVVTRVQRMKRHLRWE